LATGEHDWKQIRHRGYAPASIRQRVTPTQQQKPAATPVDEILDQLLLCRREGVLLHPTADGTLIGKEVLDLVRESPREFLRIGDSLAINLVFARAHHGRDLHDAIVIFGAPNELILPARLTLYIKDAPLFGLDVHQARKRVVGTLRFARKWIDRKGKRFGSGRAGIEKQIFRLDIAVRAEGDLASREPL